MYKLKKMSTGSKRAWIAKSIGGFATQLQTFTSEVVDNVLSDNLDSSHSVDGFSEKTIDCQRLREDKVDLEQRLEAAELQISTMSAEYRNLLDAKVMEIADLKKFNHDLSALTRSVNDTKERFLIYIIYL